MSSVRSARPLCGAYRRCLSLALPRNIATTPLINRPGHQISIPLQNCPLVRTFYATKNPYNSSQQSDTTSNDIGGASQQKTDAKIETAARRARETFGETLPRDFLSPEEYSVYERLYGPPVRETTYEDAELLQGFEVEKPQEEESSGTSLYRENDEGELEDVEFESEMAGEAHPEEDSSRESRYAKIGEVNLEEDSSNRALSEENGDGDLNEESSDKALYEEDDGGEVEEVEFGLEVSDEYIDSIEKDFYGEEGRGLEEISMASSLDFEGDLIDKGYKSANQLQRELNFEGDPVGDFSGMRNEKLSRPPSEDTKEFRARVMLFKDIAAATKAVEAAKDPAKIEDQEEEGQVVEDDVEWGEDETRLVEEEEDINSFYPDMETEGEQHRAHSTTVEGRFGTYPSTIYLPPESLVDPIDTIISSTPNKHLAEGATKTFGGPLLPDSIATPTTTRHLQQKPIALEPTQYRMSDLEANLYLAANMPGAYATVMSTLVETRKRLGSEWLEGLLTKPDGPRILDAGSAGAGALACHELFRAGWERMRPDNPSDNPVPTGKTTVVVASSELRRRVSQMLDDTTFLPRLPDFRPSRDLPGSEAHNPALRKQFDIIVAPHTLWPLKEDYMRKAQVQNLWTLLDPNGGVLIIIEKGVPRGFEIVAHARAMLLKRHITSPGDEMAENEEKAGTLGCFDKKEDGMIIAPCTNHGTCPMYKIPGQMQGRKDYCQFSQRFIRPPFLQRLVGASHQNHEDIRFSYVAVQRGVDKRKLDGFAQNETATKAALVGFEDPEEKPNMLALPRVLSPPLKRHKHVTFDVCTPSAQLERWTTPKSFSVQGYRDARKSRWGDLWALGAKTRVLREARSGSLKGESRRPRVIEVGVGASESEDTLREISPARDPYYKKGKKGKKTKRDKRPPKLTEDDISF